MPTPPDPPAKGDTASREPSPLSLSRLRQAFAEMLSAGSQQPRGSSTAPTSDANEARGAAASSQSVSTCEISPRSVVEAILFVGRPDNQAFSARELAAAMRGVSPAEIDAVVDELKSLYDADATPYHIERGNAGYRMVLREEF